ncbi:MAG TPA: diadenylate cyclase CdaA [Synergistaceae bacterium]|nr:diadenylate cyclase CdaA [Synergistaceae bacterium]HPJ26645.1 diadenylate cyclase CdaA [Synergistaceae bacterium]HPQ38067.1 diadenylate cyclase CdaA [Synergistaceae bacterium]
MITLFSFSLGWQDIVDILVVTFILYRLFLLFVDTRVMGLFKWLLALGAVVVLSRIFQLATLSWLLAKMVTISIFSIPIVFQPELRRLMEGLGREKTLKQGQGLERAEIFADRVARALMDLRSRGIGGLFVFQRQTGLKNALRSGVPIHAEVSQELLISLFWRGNPLHDGAVILDREHILAAACYLPLTENIELSRWLGTRHRAALGISEESDAISLVVSEETREISLAVNGYISRNLNDGQVKKLLLHYYQSEDEKSFTERLKEEFRMLWPGGAGEEEDDDKA